MISPWHLTRMAIRCRKDITLLPSSMLLVGRPGTDLPNLGMELAGMLLCEVGINDYRALYCL